MEINMREFCLNTTKYLKGDTIIITKRGVPSFRLVPIDGCGIDVQKSVEYKDYVATKVQIPKKNFNEYNCGCEKVNGKYLCPKHGRV